MPENWDVQSVSPLTAGSCLYLIPTPQPGHPTIPEVGHVFRIEYMAGKRASGVVSARNGPRVTVDVKDHGKLIIEPAPANHFCRGGVRSQMQVFDYIIVEVV
ncbi:hypothetical protein SAMN02799636_01097 [Methylobacterium sp. 275MFSha3.1]|uniref:hypothetical protein n=1 Tax=Methylobacterium sp. 275MFSha3.1 TaxID=1502746 RepID=UPI0008A812EC|nr:hypothetical protein [Methylobacterium sp. 275MFSha3.1]SEH31562.1 hypothetical protein SAMN02799636_01097 [Methylobacterium sp. 275MFSha3.1]